jgi:hypothetical protein
MRKRRRDKSLFSHWADMSGRRMAKDVAAVCERDWID